MRLVRQGVMKWARKDHLRDEIRDAYKILFGKPEVIRLIGETKMCMIRCGLDLSGSGYVRVMGCYGRGCEFRSVQGIYLPD
jgi:hypothetical protein